MQLRTTKLACEREDHNLKKKREREMALIIFLVDLRFLMSVKEFSDKVIGKEWIYLERNTLHRQDVASSKGVRALKVGVISFYGLGNFTGQWTGGLFQLFRGGGNWQGFPGTVSVPTFWPFMVSLRTVMDWWVCHLVYANKLQWAYEAQEFSLVFCDPHSKRIWHNQ